MGKITNKIDIFVILRELLINKIMCPENARVVFFEDDKIWNDLVDKALVKSGHQIVFRTPNLEEALESINRFDELGVDVAIVDGNLESDECLENNGEHGRIIAEQISEKKPKTRIIGFSNIRFRGKCNVDLGKEKAYQLGEVITKL